MATQVKIVDPLLYRHEDTALLSQAVADLLAQNEIQAIEDNEPIEYFVVNPLMFTPLSRSPLKNLFFEARTLSGAILKLDEHATYGVIYNLVNQFIRNRDDDYWEESPGFLESVPEEFSEEEMAREFVLYSLHPRQITTQKSDCKAFVLVSFDELNVV